MDAKLKSGKSPRHTPKFLRQRKFLVVIPLLILPFTTMAFWALGGGKSTVAPSENASSPGLNATLPQAQFKNEKSEDKMSIYQTSQKGVENSENDGVSKSFIRSMGFQEAQTNRDSAIGLNKVVSPNEADVNEAKIQEKLAQINKQLSQPEITAPINETNEHHSSADVKRLNKMMKTINSGHSDPEMRQLSKMLDKIQEIQNPESVRPKAGKTTVKPFRAIPAIIDGKQKVMDGAAVRLKLTDSVTIKNQFLEKGQQLFGSCQVANQRLLLTISNIRKGNNIIPVDLTVFSQDGMPGIPAPEAELAGSASMGADNAIQNMQILSIDQSIGAQAAVGGVNAAKSLFSKKIKKIKVKLKDEFPVLLKINK